MSAPRTVGASSILALSGVACPFLPARSSRRWLTTMASLTTSPVTAASRGVVPGLGACRSLALAHLPRRPRYSAN
eukprot:2784865-Alexandrium_andersonii.AAC.1